MKEYYVEVSETQVYTVEAMDEEHARAIMSLKISNGELEDWGSNAVIGPDIDEVV